MSTTSRSRESQADAQASSVQALYNRLCEGDKRARVELVASYGPYLVRVLRGVTRWSGRQDLPDLLQETYKRIFERLPTLREPLALKGWMARIAFLTALETLRSRRRSARIRYVSFTELPDHPTDLRPDDDAAEAFECFHKLVSKLPNEERLAFVLRKVHGLDLETVADQCGVSPSTIKRRYRRAEKVFLSRAREQPALRPWLDAS